MDNKMHYTMNPSPSDNPCDAEDNARTLDEFMLTDNPTVNNRLKKTIPSLKGYRDKMVLDAEEAARLATQQAESYRDEAEQARDDAIAAASASGDFVFARNLADMNAKLPLPDNTIIEVAIDANHDDCRTRYVVIEGVPTFILNLDRVQQMLSAPNGTINIGLPYGRNLYDKLLVDAIDLRDFGVVGDEVTDDTEAFLRAKAYAESRKVMMLGVPGMRIFLSQKIRINKFSGIYFPGSANAYSYQNLENASSALIFAPGTVKEGEVAITFDGEGICAEGFMIYSSEWTGAGMRNTTYSSRFKNIRVLGFEASHIKCGQGDSISECIFNEYENIDCYSRRYGLVTGRDETYALTSGAVNEATFINCRYRGTTHSLWLNRYGTPQSYGLVFINLIVQETAPLGDGYFDIVKAEGNGLRGVTFINGRIECTAQAGRKQPRINLTDLTGTKTLFFTQGTYIHSSIEISDPNRNMQGIGNVYNERAFLKSLDSENIRSNSLSTLDDSVLRISLGSRVSDPFFEYTRPTDTQLLERSRAPFVSGSSTENTKMMEFRRGNVWDSAAITAKAVSNSPVLALSVGGVEKLGVAASSFRPTEDNSFDLGTATNRFRDVRAANGTIITSDEREKTLVQELSESERLVAIELKGLIRKFKWVDAVNSKGIKARWHFGVMAQEVKSVFEKHGLDAHEYGILCYDEWGDEYAPVMEKREVENTILEPDGVDDDGNEVYKEVKEVAVIEHDTGETKLVRKAGNRYGIRYDELMAMILSAL